MKAMSIVTQAMIQSIRSRKIKIMEELTQPKSNKMLLLRKMERKLSLLKRKKNMSMTMSTMSMMMRIMMIKIKILKQLSIRKLNM